MRETPDPSPDPAALDELSRAFEEEPLASDAAVGRIASGSDGPPRVIQIEDDLDGDVPAPLYLDEVLEGSGDGGATIPTIVIAEPDVPDEIEREPAAVARIHRRRVEPRHRQRRVALRRLFARRRLYWTVLALVSGLVAIVALAVLGSPLFAVRADQVVVSGAVYTDPERLEAVLDDIVGTPSLRVDTRRLELELESIPWVERARVRVEFPYGATVEIRERGATTTYQGPDGRYRVLDREGRVLDVIEGYPFAYVLLGGPDPIDLEPGMFAPVGYAAASELARNLTPSVRGRVDRIDVRADGTQLIMFLDDGSEVYFGEARDFFAKLLRLETVLAYGPEREPGPIDVSTADVTS
ncbi:MAG: cell division protein FtsQ/DivIB [Ilumatobacteraceae bacterium]